MSKAQWSAMPSHRPSRPASVLGRSGSSCRSSSKLNGGHAAHQVAWPYSPRMIDTPLTGAQQCEAYRRMLRIRIFETEGSRLYTAGRIPGAFHASIGQEAAIVGACLALRADDF